jgi:hypothetical protein
MSNLSINIVDLSDEILLLIFKKINNIELLNSILSISQRLDQIVCDTSLTDTLDLTNISCNDANSSNTNEIFRRFSTYVLPRIHCNVVSLAVQGSMYHQIFGFINYPNLRKVTFDNVKLDMASQIFTGMLHIGLSTFDK